MKIEKIKSPFYDIKRLSTRMLIIHHTGSTNGNINSFSGTVSWFTNPETHPKDANDNPKYPVSSHYAIPTNRWNGVDVVQFVEELHVAYHAGRSQYEIDGKLVKSINRHSIGIELQGDGNLFEYTDYQYDILIKLTDAIITRNPDIRLDLIVGHEHISPKRKVDPGKFFDWDRYLKAVGSKVEEHIYDDMYLNSIGDDEDD